jgi:uncharacterized protein (TIGR00375 family)
MKIIADLHIHSKYSRATSKQMEPEMLALWAQKKGINLIAAGDFTHPKYLAELRERLVEDGTGFLRLKTGGLGDRGPETGEWDGRFVLSGEISCIYTDKGKTRRVHLLILAPDFATVEKINNALTELKCNLKSDGRPIVGLSAKRVAQICFDANEKTIVIPAHVWTPWFSVLGSKSGYDSLEECFEDLTPKIFAIETGLSSDPAMNWRVSALDRLTLVSNSDAHSPANLGREANVLEMSRFDYDELRDILKTKDKSKLLYTIEFFPQEGKYHSDGHAICKFSCSPDENNRSHHDVCPVCKKKMTIGVEHRVVDLSDRQEKFVPENSIPFKNVVPLQEIIAECMNKTKSCKGVIALYEKMTDERSEFEILLDIDENEIEKISNKVIAEAVMRMRTGKVYAKAGYDGEYGVIKVFSPEENATRAAIQKNLF